MLVGGIEAGGTKFVCAVTDGKMGYKNELVCQPRRRNKRCHGYLNILINSII